MKLYPVERWLLAGLFGLGLVVGCSASRNETAMTAPHGAVVCATPVNRTTQAAPQVVMTTSACAPCQCMPTVANTVVPCAACVTPPAAAVVQAVAIAPTAEAPASNRAMVDPEVHQAGFTEPRGGIGPRGESAPVRKSYVDFTAADCFAHAADYSSLTGQVEQSRHGCRLRFASVDEQDEHGGSVSLTGDASLSSLKDGQYLRVQGHLADPENKSAAPPYHVDSFDTLDKQD